MSQADQDLKRTPLYDKHVELGAKMVPFSGWNMPVQYTGIIDEHMHTREKAGLFDICHMGELVLKGPGAEKDVSRLVTCRIDDVTDGKCRYGFLLNDNGGIIDDLIVFKVSREEFMLVVNAGTAPKDKKWIEGHISSETRFIDESDNIAKLDLQGPLSAKVMASIIGEEAVAKLKRYYFVNIDIDGIGVVLSQTGYTGELGYELFFPTPHVEKFWDILSKCEGVRPVGLGARDTLRMEMGYSLYGNDIDEEHTPLEANLARFLHMDKDFIGKDALLGQEEQGASRILKGFICEGRRSARQHFAVTVSGKPVGEVTSGTFSPCLKKGIGLCYIDKDLTAEGTEILLSDGATEIRASVKNIPIYKR